MRKRAAYATLVAVLFLCVSASAQRAGETIEVSIVNVDVHVTDKNGNRVTGLRAEDFEIREDGKLQPITNFAEYTAPVATVSVEGGAATPAPAAAQAPVPRARRTIIVFIEPVTLVHFRAKQFFDSIRGLLHETVAKGDQVAIVSFVRTMRLRQPFTDDMASVDQALATLEKEMSGAEGTRFEENVHVLNEAAAFEEEFGDILSEAGLGAETTDIPLSQLAAARRQLFLIKQKAAALEALMQSISGADGRKIVIMATKRFGQYAGAEFFGGVVPGRYQQELDTAPYLDSVIRMANAHGITIYPVHAEGLRSTAHNDPAISGHDRMESTLDQDLGRTSFDNNVLLNESAVQKKLADATGGLTAWGSADIAKLLPRVADDLEAYYSLAYRTPTTRKDGARNIVVRTKNADYVVRARRQFVEKSAVTEMKDRVVANLYQKVGGSSAPIPFDVALGDIKKNGRNRWSVPIKVKVPIKSLTMLPDGDGRSGEFSVYVATGGVLGVMSVVSNKTQTFRIAAADLQRAESSHFTYELTLDVDRIANRLSVGVLDEVGKEFGLKRYTLPKRQ